MSDNSDYGGSAREAEDSRRTHEFLNRRGELLVREEPDRIILSVKPALEARAESLEQPVGKEMRCYD
jgi:hypothetical protein